MPKQNKNSLGSLKQSLLNPICDGNASVPSVSKYFKNIASSSSCSEPFDSPYKDSLSHIKNISLCDDDFGTPTYVKKVSKIQPKHSNKIIRKSRARAKTSKKIDSMFKQIKNNSETMDVNPDHLQMALALSKSSYESENADSKCDQEENVNIFLCPEKIPKIRTTLERFGFKSKRPQLHSEYKSESDVKRKKYSRFRYVKPTLLMRTDDDRRSLIQSKISLILTERQLKLNKKILDVHILSENLEKIHVDESRIMKINSMEYKDLNSSCFYVDINITTNGTACGCLLKKWSEIPGRDLSPERVSNISHYRNINQSNDVMNKSHIGGLSLVTDNLSTILSSGENIAHNPIVQIGNSTKSEEYTSQCVDSTSLHEFLLIQHAQSYDSTESHLDIKTNISSPDCVEDTFKINSRYCLSPDLFDYSSETSPKLKTPLKVINTAKGIEHFESSNENSEFLSQEISNYSKKHSYANLSLVTKDSCLDTIENCESGDSDCTLNYDIRDVKNFVYDIINSDGLKSNSSENTRDRDEFDAEKCQSDLTKEDTPEDDYTIDLTQSSNEKWANQIEKSNNECDSQDNSNYSSDVELPSFREYLKRSFQGDMINLSQSSGSDTESYEPTQNSPIFKNTDSTSKESISFDSSNDITSDRLSLLSKRHSSYNCSTLNITEYIHEMLNNQNVSKGDLICGRKSINAHKSEDSIVISDEELNYSSLCSAKDSNLKNFSISMDNKKACLDPSNSSDHCTIIDEELNYFIGCRHPEKYDTEKTSKHELDVSTFYAKSERCRKFYDLSDDDEISKVFIDDIDKANSELQGKYSKNEMRSQCAEPNESNKGEDHMTSPLEVSMQENSLELRNVQSTESVIVPSGALVHENSSSLVGNFNENTNDVRKKAFGSKQAKKIIRNSNKPSKDNDSSKRPNTPVMKFKLKTRDVTPEPEYERMSSPDIVRELKRFGIKKMKRNRGIQFLRYIYECTHPLVDSEEAHKFFQLENGKTRRKKNVSINNCSSVTNYDMVSTASVIPIHVNFMNNMSPDDFILERKTTTKLISCALPLQIAWHNLVCCNFQLRKNVLTYEPLQLESIHKLLKEETGCKYHIEDFIKFLDKKCITFRMLQSGPRTKKRI